MLKHEITYENLDGKTITETLYFNMTQPEFSKFDGQFEGGIEGELERLNKSQNASGINEFFARFLLLSYGIKSEDGNSFIKNDDLRNAFEQTVAFENIFMDLGTNEEFAQVFLDNVVSKRLSKEVEKQRRTQNLPLPSPEELSKE